MDEKLVNLTHAIQTLTLTHQHFSHPLNSDHWEQHPEAIEIEKLQDRHRQSTEKSTPHQEDLGDNSGELTSSDDEESDADVESNDVGESDFKRNDDDDDDRSERRRFSMSNKYALLSPECSLDLDF